MTAEVAGLTLNCSATNFTTAVKGAPSGTDKVRNGKSLWPAFVILNVTFYYSYGFGCCASAYVYESTIFIQIAKL